MNAQSLYTAALDQLQKLRDLAEKADKMRGEALLALSIMQNERDAAEAVIAREKRISDSEMMALLRRRSNLADEQQRILQSIHDLCEGSVDDGHRLCNDILGLLDGHVEKVKQKREVPTFVPFSEIAVDSEFEFQDSLWVKLDLLEARMCGTNCIKKIHRNCMVIPLPTPAPPDEPWAAEKKAHAEGKVIQTRPISGELQWNDTPNPRWLDYHEYRIKPEPIAPTQPDYRRAEFEKEMANRSYYNLLRSLDGGEYLGTDIQKMWLTWCAAIDANQGARE